MKRGRDDSTAYRHDGLSKVARRHYRDKYRAGLVTRLYRVILAAQFAIKLQVVGLLNPRLNWLMGSFDG